MSLRFRRSISILPGVRLNFSKSTVGLSLGVPGARVSINSRGDIYTSAGIPGTGLYAVERSSSKSRARRRNGTESEEDQSAEVSVLPKPGLLATGQERVFSKFLAANFDGIHSSFERELLDQILALGVKYPKIEMTYLALANLIGARLGDEYPALLENCAKVWQESQRAFGSHEAEKYFRLLTLQIPITDGITTSGFFDKAAFGFLYAEILQADNQSEKALLILEALEPTQLTLVSINDIALGNKKYQEVLDETEDIEIEDEATAILFIMRAVALSNLGFDDGALEALKKVRGKRSLDEEVHSRALWERANILAKQGKISLALKELEKIVLADSKYPEVFTRIAELRKKI